MLNGLRALFGLGTRAGTTNTAASTVSGDKKVSFGAALALFFVGTLSDTTGFILFLFGGIGAVLDPLLVVPLTFAAYAVIIYEGGGSLLGSGVLYALAASAFPGLGIILPAGMTFGIIHILRARK